MRAVTVILIILLALIQYPLWWGQGGWLRVHALAQQLAAQQRKNAQLKLRNDRIAGEVQDLRDGAAAIEERARYELGMIKDGEVFIQFVSPNIPIPLPTARDGKTAPLRRRRSMAPLAMVPEPPPDAKAGGASHSFEPRKPTNGKRHHSVR